MISLVLIALLGSGIISQAPAALGDDSENPLSSFWDAIFDLQSRDEDLQSQVDELRAEIDQLKEERITLVTQTSAEPAIVSDPYAKIEVETKEDGRTLLYITAGNSGPDRAAGVKLTVFYLMPLFEINSIDDDLCEDKSRGIIECTLGTIEKGETTITIDATSLESGRANTWTVDISTTTSESSYSNNHITYDFETGSSEQIEIPNDKQSEEEIIEEPEAAQPEQDNESTSEIEEHQRSARNQTSSTEQDQDPIGNQTSNETEGSSSNSTTTTESEENQSSKPEENISEPAEEETQEESNQSEEQAEEPAASEESVAEESSEQDTGTESSGSEESGNESSGEESTPENSDNGEQDSGEDSEPSESNTDDGENISS